MSKRTVCKALLDILADAHARDIFGFTRDALNSLLEAIRTDARFRWIGVRHEEHAGYAAQAQSQIAGGIGVCAGTTGPAALHLINGLYTAKKDGSGVVASTGQVPLAERGSNFHKKEVDLTKIYDDSVRRVVILGGGFAGVYTAQQLERRLRNRDDVEVVLVSQENYLVFQPMLPEVISGNIGILDTVAPIRRLLPNSRLYVRQVESVDFGKQTVSLSPGFQNVTTELKYDRLVIALGNVTDFRRIPGLHDHAFPYKNLGDALRLRDHLIHVMGEAADTKDADLRRQLLTFVVGGGGFTGVEVCAELNDFVRRCGKKYFRLDPNEIRVVLVHAADRILNREMPESLGLYAQNLLAKRGVEFIFNARLKTATPESAVLADGKRIATRTLISSVPSSPNPVLGRFSVPQERGRIISDLRLQVKDSDKVWALGDCALIPSPSGEGFCPPTAQFAIRQARTCGDNIVASIDGEPQIEFDFSELGKMASLGHRRAIVRLFDRFNIQGFFAWMFWRAAYLAKMPGFDRKVKLGISWFMDLFCPPEIVQTNLDQKQSVFKEHFEPGEWVIRGGDLGNRVSIVVAGKAQVGCTNSSNEQWQVIHELGPGQCLGVTEVMEGKSATYDVRCLEAMELISYPAENLEPLLHLPEVRQAFESLRL